MRYLSFSSTKTLEELEKSLLALQSAAAGALSEGAGLLLGMGTDGALMFIAVVNQANPASRIDIDYCRQRYSWEVETLRENVALLVMNGKEPDKEAFLSAKVMIDAAGMYQGASLSVHGASQSGMGALLLALPGGEPIEVAVVVTGAGEMAAGALITETSGWRLVDNLQEMSSGGKGEADSKKNKIPDNDSTTGHIFRDAEGHIPDTPENRALLEDVANDSTNFRGTDKYGNEWYTKTQSDGSQVWVESRNGNIFEGGVNNTPKPWNPETGLKKP